VVIGHQQVTITQGLMAALIENNASVIVRNDTHHPIKKATLATNSGGENRAIPKILRVLQLTITGVPYLKIISGLAATGTERRPITC